MNTRPMEMRAVSDTPRTERLLAAMEVEKKDIWQALKTITDWARALERECASYDAALAVAAAPEGVAQVEPFVVRHYTSDERPTIKGNGFDGLEIGTDRDEADVFVAWINARLGMNSGPT